MSTCSRLTWLIFLSTLTCYVNKLTLYLINLLIAAGSNEQTFVLELRSGSKIADVSGAQSHSVDEKCWKVGGNLSAFWHIFGGGCWKVGAIWVRICIHFEAAPAGEVGGGTLSNWNLAAKQWKSSLCTTAEFSTAEFAAAEFRRQQPLIFNHHSSTRRSWKGRGGKKPGARLWDEQSAM